ncbi:hypothetical protein TR51_01465 [Kitasatospora griseola]|uniref:Uncharacterized protein n=1 Tax=Kitasatospora griseola TaxID=2064 RepID=A0A0D0P3Z4_KITGR|nr:hypothetical protein TR51_01465 [Kitasatospora griseola]
MSVPVHGRRARPGSTHRGDTLQPSPQRPSRAPPGSTTTPHGVARHRRSRQPGCGSGTGWCRSVGGDSGLPVGCERPAGA